jgi:uncharacterized repeat protein (TIGR02059 family)
MTGAGKRGRSFVDGVAKLFNTAVSAFSGLVGNQRLGGSWAPDVLAGGGVAVSPFTATPAYAHTLVVSDDEAPKLSGSFNSGNSLTLTFSEPVTGAVAGDFLVSIAGEAASVMDVSINSDQLVLTLDSSAEPAQLVRFSYSGESLQDASGNKVSVFSAASFVYSTQYWGTLFDWGQDGSYDFMQIVENESDNPEEMDLDIDLYRIVEGANPASSADYTAQKVMEFGLGSVDASGRPTSYFAEETEYPIAWLATPGADGLVATSSLTFYSYVEDGEDVAQDGTVYFYNSDGDATTFESMEVWYTPEGSDDLKMFGALDVLEYSYDESGHPESMTVALTTAEHSGNDLFDFSMDGGKILLPFDEYEEPSGYFPVELVADTNPADTIVAKFNLDSDSGYVSDLDGDGEIDFLRVLEDGDDDPDDYYITWSDEINWTAHRIEYFGFDDYSGGRPSSLVLDFGEVELRWQVKDANNVVATATFDDGDSLLSFIDDTGDWKPDWISYEGSDGSEMLDIPDISWQYDSGNPVSAWAVLMASEGDDDDRVFSGMMKFDGDGNPVTLLVPESGEDEYDSSVYITDGRLVFDSGVDGVTVPGTGDVTITHITHDGGRETFVLPVTSLSADGSMLSLPLSGADVEGAHYELNLAWFSMLRIRVPDGLLDDGNMMAWKLDGENGDDLHFVSYHVSCCDGSSYDDWLFGTSGDDSIYAGNDSDFIEWSGGDDTVDAGDGHDTLYLPWDESDGYVSTRVDVDDVYYLSSSNDGIDRYAVTRLTGDNVLLVEQLDDDGNPVSSVQFTNGEVLRVAQYWEISVSNQELNNSGYIHASPWDDEIDVSVNSSDFDELFQVWGNYGEDTLQLDLGTGYSGFNLQKNDSTYDLFGEIEVGGNVWIGSFVKLSSNNITASIDDHTFRLFDVENILFVSDAVYYNVDFDSWQETADTTSPLLIGADAIGSMVTLHYNEPLDPVSIAGANRFGVQVNGSAVDVNSVEVSGNDVVLSLDSSIHTGDSVSVSYTDPSVNNDYDAVQDLSGNDAGYFVGYEASVAVPDGVTVNVSYWQFGGGIPDVTVIMTDESSNETPGQSLGWGEYDFGTLEEGEYTLTATRVADAYENDLLITEDDAEAAFDLALGHDASSPYQYLAADIDRDGTVGFRDALGILKIAMDRDDAPEPEWTFVPESVGSEPMSSDNVVWPDAEMPVTVSEGTEINMVGVLLGDVELAGLW